MASSKAVLAALKMLSRAFAGVVDAERVELYRVALDDLSDEQIATATAGVIRTHTGEYIPPPAVLRKAIAPAAVVVDSTALVREIEKLATYNPNSGMIAPSVALVRERLGEAVGYAYAAAGAQLVLSDDATTRAIALRDFQRAMREAAERPQAALPVLGLDALPAATDPDVVRLTRDTAKRLGAGGAR